MNLPAHYADTYFRLLAARNNVRAICRNHCHFSRDELVELLDLALPIITFLKAVIPGTIAMNPIPETLKPAIDAYHAALASISHLESQMNQLARQRQDCLTALEQLEQKGKTLQQSRDLYLDEQSIKATRKKIHEAEAEADDMRTLVKNIDSRIEQIRDDLAKGKDDIEMRRSGVYRELHDEYLQRIINEAIPLVEQAFLANSSANPNYRNWDKYINRIFERITEERFASLKSDMADRLGVPAE